MKKILFPILFLLAGESFGATYYVDSTGGLDSNQGLSETQAWKTLARVNGAAFNAGDVVLFKRGCTWNEELVASSSGDDANPIMYGAYGSGGEAVIAGGPYRALNTNGKHGLRFERICFRDKPLYVSGSSGVTIAFCVVRDSGERGILVQNSSGVTVLNCTITRNRGEGVCADGASCSVTVRNCLIFGNGMDYYSGLNAINNGRLAYDHCLVSGNGYPPGINLPGSGVLVDNGYNREGELPGITRYSHPEGCFVITSEDYDVDYWKKLDATLRPLGVRFTLFMNGAFVPADRKEDLRALSRAGNELAIHGWSHSSLVADTLFTVSTANASPSIVVDAAAKEIRLTCGDAARNVTLSWASEPKTIDDLRAAVAGRGWDIAINPVVTQRVLLSSALDSGGQRADFPYVARADVRGPECPYWRDEITTAKTWMESEFGVTPVSVAYPSGHENAPLRAWLKDHAGMSGVGARVVTPGGNLLSSVDVFRCPGVAASLFKGDGSERAIRAAARNAFIHAVQDGCIYVLYTHNETDMSPLQLSWFVDEVKRAGGTFKTFGEAIRDIRATPASTADGYVYAREWPDRGDFHPLGGSPCIDAGAAISAAFDYDGKPLPLGSGYDIGAMEYGVPPTGFTITAAVTGGNGMIEPLGKTTVDKGGSRKYVITAAPGYVVGDVLVDGTSVGPVDTFTFTDVRADHTITASFTKVSGYIITASADENGEISPKGAVTVAIGGNRTFTITPCPGYMVKDVLVDGVSVGAVTSYEFTDVQKNHTIAAVFRKIGCIIVATADKNGTISPSGTITLREGACCKFTITPCPGYEIRDVIVNGVSVGPVTCYSFIAVRGSHTITARFKHGPNFTITADAGQHGCISPSGAVKVAVGLNQTFTITPHKGYRIASVLTCGKPAGPVESFTFSNVRENHTITATFVPICEDENGDDRVAKNDDKKGKGSGKASIDCYPNPFNPATTIRFNLPSDERVRLAVYNISGQKVRELLDDTREAGVHTIIWNGRDESGRTVSSGVYFARMETPGAVLNWRMVFMK